MKLLKIKLTGKQQEELEPMFEIINKMATDNRKGMLIAQIWPSVIEVGILSHEEAKKLKHFSEGTLKK